MATAEELAAQADIARIGAQAQRELELKRIKSASALEERRTKLDLIRIAHTTLTENKKALPVTERVITIEEILAFADQLEGSLPPIPTVE